jgi:hypothetical protein
MLGLIEALLKQPFRAGSSFAVLVFILNLCDLMPCESRHRVPSFRFRDGFEFCLLPIYLLAVR